jgi:4-hydroxybenzoyl-CoA reductase subunit beta
MQGLPALHVQRPTTAAEALALLAREPAARPIAGGTDLIPNLRRGLGHPPLLIDLSALEGFDTITFDADGGCTLGAGVTLATLAADAGIRRRLGALADAAQAAAGPGHRSAATLGGNLCQDTRCMFYNQSAWWRQANGYCLKRDGDTCHVAPQGGRCHAAFCSDLAPVLLALGCSVTLQSVRGSRRLALQALYRDDGAAHLTHAADELLTTVHIEAPAAGQRCATRKARERGAMDFALAAVAVALALADGRLSRLRVGVTGTDSFALLLQGTEELLGRPVDDALVARVGKLVQQQVRPMRSTVTPAHYRRQVASALVQRLLRELAAG